MSIADPKIIMGRIKSARTNSPIAVFRCNQAGAMNAVFAACGVTKGWLKDGTGLVGVYDKTVDMAATYMKLRDHAFRDIGGNKQALEEVI